MNMITSYPALSSIFFFNDPATTEIYTLSLHDALPILWLVSMLANGLARGGPDRGETRAARLQPGEEVRSEEHTSELQSRLHLVCRLLLEKKKKKENRIYYRQGILSG